MNTVTIRFRAKRDTYGEIGPDGAKVGEGYRVPKLTASHITFATRDTVATLIAGHRDPGAALARYVEIPPVVWASDPGAWDVRPIGRGFMADVSITVPMARR